MRKFLILTFLSIYLTGCASISDLVNLVITPTPIPIDTTVPTVTPAAGDTPTPTQTLIPTLTPTLTFTPTQIGPTAFPDIVTITAIPTLADLSGQSLFLPGTTMFMSVTTNTDRIYWGSHCEGPRYIDFSVRANALRAKYILLFLRLDSKVSAESTKWGAGAIMQKDDAGFYTYHVTLDTLTNYRAFEEAWVVFQIVAATSTLKRLGATPVYADKISLIHCPVPGQ